MSNKADFCHSKAHPYNTSLNLHCTTLSISIITGEKGLSMGKNRYPLRCLDQLKNRREYRGTPGKRKVLLERNKDN